MSIMGRDSTCVDNSEQMATKTWLLIKEPQIPAIRCKCSVCPQCYGWWVDASSTLFNHTLQKEIKIGHLAEGDEDIGQP